MTEFTDLMASLARSDDAWHVTVSDDWLQGRTVYGGMAAALCVQAAISEFPDLPPLRSAQFAFIGPASGELKMQPSILRKGKSTVFIGVDLIGDAGLATRATLCFGTARQSALTYENIPAPPVPRPEQSKAFFRDVKGLNFVAHYEGLLAAGHPPMSRGDAPEMALWLRHRDPASPMSVVALLALADAPPPAAMVLFEKFAPISTMTWSIDMLDDTIATDDGWWLVRTTAQTARDGYSSQAMIVWNAAGKPMMACRQNVAIFI